jgi:hypothetical protein
MTTPAISHQFAAFRAHLAAGSKYGSKQPALVRNGMARLEIKAASKLPGAGSWLNRKVTPTTN